jgi:hypothetical protein
MLAGSRAPWHTGAYFLEAVVLGPIDLLVDGGQGHSRLDGCVVVCKLLWIRKGKEIRGDGLAADAGGGQPLNKLLSPKRRRTHMPPATAAAGEQGLHATLKRDSMCGEAYQGELVQGTWCLQRRTRANCLHDMGARGEEGQAATVREKSAVAVLDSLPPRRHSPVVEPYQWA